MPRQPNLAQLSITAIQAEIQRRQKLLPKLIKERDALNARIADIQGMLGQAAAPAKPKAKKPDRKPGQKAKRVKNTTNLPDALAAVFAGKEKMGVGEAAEAVQAAGYKTNSSIFRTIVNQTLLKDQRFQKVGRGQYTLKATKADAKPEAKNSKGKPGRKPGRKPVKKPVKVAGKAPEAPKTPDQATA